MNQYLITGYDHTDEGALARRMSVRPRHLGKNAELKKTGNFIFGGAILNEEGNMAGSVMVMAFETEEELEVWKQNEPYITQGVWESYDVKPFKVATVG
ncbi:MAG TPA: YciI family protein [Mucilaginibacter sp.]